MRWIAPIILAAAATIGMGEVVTLKDGTRVAGTVKRTPHGWQITTADGSVTKIDASQVQSIEVGSPPGDDSQRAAQRLASLRRTVDNLRDIDQIIERYTRFLETGPPDAIDEAKQELQLWQQRKAQGMLKVGQEWVTPQRRLELFAESLTAAHEARELMKQNRLTEAQPLLVGALRVHPENVTALYLRGVLLYQRNQLVQARESFEAAAQVLPDHAPTLNNLGVIVWRQNRHTAALNYYLQALQVSKLNAQILNNTAEALHALSGEQSKHAVAQRLSRAFLEQESQLQPVMAQQGLYRWGATWVQREQLEQLREIERQINAKLAEMAAQYDEAEARIGTIDQSIKETERSMRRIEAQSYVRDVEGRIWRVPYPSVYYDLERDLRDLRQERNALVRSLQTLREQARRVQQDLPVPQYTGVQQLIGLEGTPLMIPQDMSPDLLPPAMRAATQPPAGSPPDADTPGSDAPQAEEPAEREEPASQ
jgi:tetratricopeptide (TPR) repeat protein